jgi:hypothetical protein
MNNLRIILLAWPIIMLLSSCEQNGDEINITTKEKFFIYNVAETEVPYTRLSIPNDLNDVTLEKTPVITEDDIGFYDYSAHYIYLKDDAIKRVNDNLPDHGNFMVMVGSTRVYLGTYHPIYASSIPSFPFISTPVDWRSKNKKIIPIQLMQPLNDTIRDPRSELIIHETLDGNNILREGISVDVNHIEIQGGRLSFNLLITNQEEHNIWVLDPGKDEVAFSYYTTAPYLLNQTNNFFQNNDNNSPASISWSKNYYSRLYPDQTLSRQLVFDNYPHIGPGDYTFHYSYGSPVINDTIEVGYNERFWMGSISIRKSITN